MKWILKVIPSLTVLGLHFPCIAFSAIEFPNEENIRLVSRTVDVSSIKLHLGHERASAPFLTGIAPLSTFKK
jgi:hypothetical protein